MQGWARGGPLTEEGGRARAEHECGSDVVRQVLSSAHSGQGCTLQLHLQCVAAPGLRSGLKHAVPGCIWHDIWLLFLGQIFPDIRAHGARRH